MVTKYAHSGKGRDFGPGRCIFEVAYWFASQNELLVFCREAAIASARQP
jgi:hypothetical protein